MRAGPVVGEAHLLAGVLHVRRAWRSLSNSEARPSDERHAYAVVTVELDDLLLDLGFADGSIPPGRKADLLKGGLRLSRLWTRRARLLSAPGPASPSSAADAYGSAARDLTDLAFAQPRHARTARRRSMKGRQPPR
jgi:hypothetical protein